MRIVYAVNNETEENRLRKITGIEELIGCYKGNKEVSFMESIQNETELNDALKYAERYKQESVLLIDSQNKARLVFLETGKTVEIGTWTQVQKIEGLEAYTIDKNGNFFICK